MAAVWKGAHRANFAVGRHGGWQPEAIVIHVMDGSLSGTDAWFNDPASSVSAHYGIGTDGTVHQYVKEDDTAFHAGTVVKPAWPEIRKDAQGRFVNPNLYTIGIEHAGWGTKTDPWPPSQRAASIALVREIAARWNIGLDARHIIPHRMIRSSKPDCPGKGLDFPAYLAALDKGIAVAPQPVPVGSAFTQQVRATTTLNVRSAPTKLGPARRKMLPGDAFAPTEAVEGEAHRGNNRWYRNAANEFIWAGGTDLPRPV